MNALKYLLLFAIISMSNFSAGGVAAEEVVFGFDPEADTPEQAAARTRQAAQAAPAPPPAKRALPSAPKRAAPNPGGADLRSLRQAGHAPKRPAGSATEPVPAKTSGPAPAKVAMAATTPVPAALPVSVPVPVPVKTTPARRAAPEVISVGIRTLSKAGRPSQKVSILNNIGDNLGAVFSFLETSQVMECIYLSKNIEIASMATSAGPLWQILRIREGILSNRVHPVPVAFAPPAPTMGVEADGVDNAESKAPAAMPMTGSKGAQKKKPTRIVKTEVTVEEHPAIAVRAAFLLRSCVQSVQQRGLYALQLWYTHQKERGKRHPINFLAENGYTHEATVLESKSVMYANLCQATLKGPTARLPQEFCSLAHFTGGFPWLSEMTQTQAIGWAAELACDDANGWFAFRAACCGGDLSSRADYYLENTRTAFPRATIVPFLSRLNNVVLVGLERRGDTMFLVNYAKTVLRLHNPPMTTPCPEVVKAIGDLMATITSDKVSPSMRIALLSDYMTHLTWITRPTPAMLADNTNITTQREFVLPLYTSIDRSLTESKRGLSDADRRTVVTIYQRLLRCRDAWLDEPVEAPRRMAIYDRLFELQGDMVSLRQQVEFLRIALEGKNVSAAKLQAILASVEKSLDEHKGPLSQADRQATLDVYRFFYISEAAMSPLRATLWSRLLRFGQDAAATIDTRIGLLKTYMEGGGRDQGIQEMLVWLIDDNMTPEDSSLMNMCQELLYNENWHKQNRRKLWELIGKQCSRPSDMSLRAKTDLLNLYLEEKVTDAETLAQLITFIETHLGAPSFYLNAGASLDDVVRSYQKVLADPVKARSHLFTLYSRVLEVTGATTEGYGSRPPGRLQLPRWYEYKALGQPFGAHLVKYCDAIKILYEAHLPTDSLMEQALAFAERVKRTCSDIEKADNETEACFISYNKYVLDMPVAAFIGILPFLNTFQSDVTKRAVDWMKRKITMNRVVGSWDTESVAMLASCKAFDAREFQLLQEVAPQLGFGLARLYADNAIAELKAYFPRVPSRPVRTMAPPAVVSPAAPASDVFPGVMDRYELLSVRAAPVTTTGIQRGVKPRISAVTSPAAPPAPAKAAPIVALAPAAPKAADIDKVAREVFKALDEAQDIPGTAGRNELYVYLARRDKLAVHEKVQQMIDAAGQTVLSAPATPAPAVGRVGAVAAPAPAVPVRVLRGVAQPVMPAPAVGGVGRVGAVAAPAPAVPVGVLRGVAQPVMPALAVGAVSAKAQRGVAPRRF